jgi:hypothetical protein
MTFWRCLKNNFAYCNGKPDFEVEPEENKIGFINDAHCKNNPETCSKYLKKLITEAVNDN